MVSVLIVMLVIVPASILCGGAVYMAINGVSGWGWFLFAAVMLGGSATFNTRTETKTERAARPQPGGRDE